MSAATVGPNHLATRSSDADRCLRTDATNFVKGFQESSADEDHILASACCKHYLANSVEHSTEDNMTWDRFEINSVVTQQDLIDSCECTHGRQPTSDVSAGLSRMSTGLSILSLILMA